MTTKRTCTLPLICHICGDVARGINFDVMSCMSCKTFFRRHAKSNNHLLCQYDNNCEINLRSRSFCSACRLKKCFALKMNPNLIGQRLQRQMKFKQKNKKIERLPQPRSLNLLENDLSTLTIYEWNLLSNILHAYDGLNLLSQVRNLLDQQCSLPPKIRSKPSVTFEIIKYFFSALQPFLERTPYFHELSTDTCTTLVRQNSPIFGTLNSTFLMREVNALSYVAFLSGCQIIYGPETMRGFEKFLIRLESNGILIKLMLLIVAFSGNCSIETTSKSNFNSISIMKIENIVVTMFWKYLIYQYGFFDAVRWLNTFIKYILDILQSSSETTNIKHNHMIDTIVDETTRLLTIDD